MKKGQRYHDLLSQARMDEADRDDKRRSSLRNGQDDAMDEEESTSSRASETISALRSAIDAKLREEGIYEEIRQLVHRKAGAQRFQDSASRGEQTTDGADPSGENAGASDVVSEEHLVREVLESEVVQQLLSMVRSTTLKDRKSQKADGDGVEDLDAINTQTGVVNENDVYLYLRLAGGKAFVDQLLAADEAESDCIGISETQVGEVKAFFRVNVVFQAQRQTSNDVLCGVDPPFDEYFRFRIEKKKTRTNRTKAGAPYEIEVVSSWEALCLVDEPVQIDVVKVSKKLVHWSSAGGPQWQETSKELLAVHRLDWRRVLCSTLQLVHLPVSLIGKMKVPIGTLDFRADLLNFKRTASIAREASAFLNKEMLQRNTLNRSFYQYAKQWWDEYRNESAIYDDDARRESDQDRDADRKMFVASICARPRLVKLFAEDDDGRFRMVCKFVTPLRAPAAIKSPSEAARFVGLLPFESDPVVGGARDETWRSIPAFLSVGKGDAQDHALLLASLLLGCGLDAYVCIGTIAASVRKSCLGVSKRKGDRDSSGSDAEIGHVWVVTRGANPQELSDIVFWESVTGEHCKLLDASRHHGYCAIDCVFNHRQFYANLQPRAWKLSDTSFSFEDESGWKPMNEFMIADLPFGQPPFPLLAPNIMHLLPSRERAWTIALKKQISSRRRANGYITRWSDELSFYLLPALNAYELERVYGVAQVENDFFQQSITRFVQEGHTFQGMPVMFTWESTQEAMEALETHELVSSILHLHARASQFGLAVRCFAYPEQIVVTWVMLAVSYQSAA